MNARIDEALSKASDTQVVVLGADVLGRTGEVFASVFGPDARAVLIADENTWAAAGEPVRQSLTDAGIDLDEPLVLPGRPTLFADEFAVEKVRVHLAGTDAYAVSIASGSLNDITKLASHQVGRSYLNVCTAASVDGFTSFGAAITTGGVKGTQECPAPAAVIVPVDVMAKAPARLTATGYGDLVEKVPAGADWLIADLLGVDPVDEYVWSLVQGPLREALADPAGLRRGDVGAVSTLADGLIMSGIAMQVLRSSRSASGAGHYFSHQWEMEGYGRDWEPPLSHGFKVGLGTVAVCAFYEAFCALDLSSYDVESRIAAWPTPEEDDARVRALQPVEVIREAAAAQSAAKYLTPEQARERLEFVTAHWGELVDRVRPQVLPAAEVAGMLAEAGAVYHPEQIGKSLAELEQTYYQAQTIRTRYTVLDLAQELGVLQTVVGGLFAPGGYWAQARA